MKDEYTEIFVGMGFWFFISIFIALVVDLFRDGYFVLLMVITLIPWSIIFLIAFIIQAFKTNYKIIKRSEKK